MNKKNPLQAAETELDPRKQIILRAVICDYVETVEPIGSETLVQRYSLGVKPATVRSELAEMAEMGLLYQPHTSAGRVPSDGGYRYFVDRLMQLSSISTDTQPSLDKLTNMHGELVHLLTETCKMLARMTQYTSLVSTVKDPGIYIKQIVLSAISSKQLLMVIVSSSGHIENRLFDAPEGCSIEDLGQASEMLNVHAANKPIRTVATSKDNKPSAINPRVIAIYEQANKLIRTFAQEVTQGKLLIEGEMHMLQQPEFQRDIDRLEALLGALEEEGSLYHSLERSAGDKVTVVIGVENSLEPMQSCSLVASRFYVGEREAGTLAVLGPTRMRYEQAIPMVESMAKSLSEVLTNLIDN